MSLIGTRTYDLPEGANAPPVWNSIPAPTFVQGVGSSYDVSQNINHPEGPVTLTLNGASAALPSGVTISGENLVYDGVGAVNTTAGIILDADDGVNPPVASSSFPVVIAESGVTFPRLTTFRIGDTNYIPDNAESAAQRDALSKLDYVVLGGFIGSEQDSGTSGWLQRAQVSQDILDRAAANGNTSISLFTYANAMETSDNGSTSANKINSESGPPGSLANWGVSDWWSRDAGGGQVSTGFGIGINISDYVIADSNGDYYTEWHAENIIDPLILQPHVDAGITIGPGGMNIFLDNFQVYARKSGIDWDGDGQNEDAQDNFDPLNATHVATDAGGVAAAGKLRAGYQLSPNRLRTLHPTIIVIGNTDTWAGGKNLYSGALPSPRYVFDEFLKTGESFADIQGGISERSVGLTHVFPKSGVNGDGVNTGQSGTWQKMYNAYTFIDRNTQSPSIGSVSCDIKGAQRASPSTTTVGAKSLAVWDVNPDPTMPFHLWRWCFATALMSDGFMSLNICDVNDSTVSPDDTMVGNYRTCVLFDETGLINTGITALYRKWMGVAIDPRQDAPRTGNLWWRELENALIIINTDNDEANAAATVPFSMLPGDASTWKRITGVQDPVHNDGSNVTADFNLDPIDAIILERR